MVRELTSKLECRESELLPKIKVMISNEAQLKISSDLLE